MNENLKSEKVQGSLIAHMSGLVKKHGGINLAQGKPGFPPPPELLNELTSLISGNYHQYPQGNGDPELIKIIKGIYSPVKSINDDQMLIVQGATEGISLIYLYLINLFGKDWNSLAFDPIYESYAQLPGIYGNNLIRTSFDADGLINWTLLEEKVLQNNVKLVFINSPGNPLCRIWTKEELDILLEMAEKQDFYVLFDAVYKDLYFDGLPPYNPIGILNHRLFYVNSFSKMLSVTGWRIGYLVCESEHMSKIRSIHDYTGLCASSILQKAIANYLQNSLFGSEYMNTLREKLGNSCNRISRELKNMGFQFDQVNAGYFIWAKLPAPYNNGMDFCLDLFSKQRVSMVPGIHFSHSGGNFVRINFARNYDEIDRALEGIQNYLKP